MPLLLLILSGCCNHGQFTGNVDLFRVYRVAEGLNGLADSTSVSWQKAKHHALKSRIVISLLFSFSLYTSMTLLISTIYYFCTKFTSLE